MFSKLWTRHASVTAQVDAARAHPHWSPQGRSEIRDNGRHLAVTRVICSSDYEELRYNNNNTQK